MADDLDRVTYRHGYITALFHSSDTRYANEDKYLAAQGLDNLQDAQTLECGRDRLYDEFDKIDSVDDKCTADALLAWISENKDKNFFGLFWTFETHYPYYVTGRSTEITQFAANERIDETFKRYLNAVRHTDEIIGQVLADLENQGLLDTTLVVILGDHGEAFGGPHRRPDRYGPHPVSTGQVA